MLMLLFAWVLGFLLHELMHVLSQGRTGVIYIEGLSMRATAEHYWNIRFFYLAGGLLSGLVFIVAGVLVFFLPTLYVVWCFFTVGVVNIIYGFFECAFLPRWGNSLKYTVGRYSLYFLIICLMVGILWRWIN